MPLYQDVSTNRNISFEIENPSAGVYYVGLYGYVWAFRDTLVVGNIVSSSSRL